VIFTPQHIARSTIRFRALKAIDPYAKQCYIVPADDLHGDFTSSPLVYQLSNSRLPSRNSRSDLRQQSMRGNLDAWEAPVKPSEKAMEKVPSEEGEPLLTNRHSAAQVPTVPARAPLVALWGWDLTANQVYFSPEGTNWGQLGAGIEFTNGLSEWEARLHPEDRERVMQGLRAYLTSPGPCYESEYRLLHRDATYRSMLLRAGVVRDPRDRPCHILGYQVDISEQIKANEGQAQLAAIVESSEDAIIGKTLDGIVTSWNEGARRLFGYTAEEMLDQPVSKIIPLEHSEAEAQMLTRLRQGEQVEHYETVRRHKDGRLVDVFLTISPIRDRSSRIIGASTIARDITEKKKAEAATRRDQEQLREQAAVLELAPVLLRDLESRIVLWTSGAERLYGYSKAEALGRVSHELLQTEFAEGKAYVDEMLCRAGQWEGELVHRKRDSKRLVVASQQFVYRDSTGQPVCIMEVNADITALKGAEENLRKSQAQLRALATRLQEAREEEAIRIGRELHDQLGRCLTAIKMDVCRDKAWRYR
jgi:PAS domain S-box-containing protein